MAELIQDWLLDLAQQELRNATIWRQKSLQNAQLRSSDFADVKIEDDSVTKFQVWRREFAFDGSNLRIILELSRGLDHVVQILKVHAIRRFLQPYLQDTGGANC